MGRFQENLDGTGKSPHIQHLRPHHRSILRAVAIADMRPTEISKAYNMSLGQVSRIMGSPVFQAEVARLQEEAEIISFDMAKDLRAMGETALENLDEDLHMKVEDLDDRKHRASVSTNVLGMLGLKSGTSASGDTYIQKILQVNNTINNNARAEEELSEQEIRDELLELTQSTEGLYE